MKDFNGEILFLDRSDINTDEIIPAKYLTENFKEALKPRLLEDLKLEGFDPDRDIEGKRAVVSRANFGCGSSREHAPWALEANGIDVVIAENFARIFRQNMFNCGMPAIELSRETIDDIFRTFSGAPARLETNFAENTLTVIGSGTNRTFTYTISDFDKTLVLAGGWVAFADERY